MTMMLCNRFHTSHSHGQWLSLCHKRDRSLGCRVVRAGSSNLVAEYMFCALQSHMACIVQQHHDRAFELDSGEGYTYILNNVALALSTLENQ